MRTAVGVALLIAAAATRAAGLGGRAQLEATAADAGAGSAAGALGHETSAAAAGELRLVLDQDWSRWRLDAAWQLDGRHGSAVTRDRELAATYPELAAAPEDDWWRWQDTLVDGTATRTDARIDRLSLEFAGPNLVLRLGRQALTWGSGLVFHPFDLVNPFRLAATDTTYKRGTDMMYLQWLLDDGSDIQVVTVPRRTHGDAATLVFADAGRDTTAVLANLAGGPRQWSLMLAKDRGDTTLGLGTSGALGGAVWNLELVPTRLAGGGTRTSALANLTYAAVLAGHNTTAFAEYYRNGFGEPGTGYSVAELDAETRGRLALGRAFVTGRDYLAVGATWEWTPLTQLEPTLITNVHDGSTLLDAQLTHSLSDEAYVKAGLRLALGGRGTEFGGLELAPSAGRTLGRPTAVFVRIGTFF